MERQEIEQLLQELGDELAKTFKQPVRVMVIGGAFMLLTLQNRETTQDIDVFPLSFPVSTTPSKETKRFGTAIRAVARRHQLRRDWTNDAAATMLGGLGPEPTVELWGRFGMLEIYFPPLDFILAMKLFADRDKDLTDIEALLQALGITTREELQAIADKYVYPRWQAEYRMHITIDRLSRLKKLL